MTKRSPSSSPTADDLLQPTASPLQPKSPAPATARPLRGGRRRNRLWVVLIAGGVISACLAMIVGIFGQVRGREFSPTHFQTRRFRVVEIPLLQLQITPIRRTNDSSPLGIYLRTAGIISSPQGPPTQWHLVELDRVAAPAAAADAKLLTDYLNQFGPGGLYWHQWSLDHPKLAAVFWPEVQKLAERELYLLIPDLFRIAQSADSATSLSRDLHRFVASSYAELIGDLRAAGQGELAESFRQEAMSDYPDDPRWQQL